MGSPLPTGSISETVAAKPVRGRPFAPGVSGNPKGRPHKLEALSDAIRRQCDPDELAAIALTIARTSKQEAMRLQALGWLRDSGYARPAARHELSVEQSAPQRDWSSLPIDERRELLERLRAVPRLDSDGDLTTSDDEPPAM